MAGERTIFWGADSTDARYKTHDTGDGANFVVAEDLDGSTVLLEWDTSASPSMWQVRGPVEMNSNDITGVSSLKTDEADITSLLQESGFDDSQSPLEPPIIDDFEAQDTSYLSGDAASLTIETSEVKQGNAALASSSQETAIRTPFEVRRGFKYTLLLFFEDTGGTNRRDQQLFFGTAEGTFTTNGDGYEFRVRGEDNSLIIARWDSGGFNSLASESPTVPKGEWLRVEMTVGFDELKLDVFQMDGTQVGSGLSTTDANHNPEQFFLQYRFDNRNSDKNIIDYITRRPI